VAGKDIGGRDLGNPRPRHQVVPGCLSELKECNRGVGAVGPASRSGGSGLSLRTVVSVLSALACVAVARPPSHAAYAARSTLSAPRARATLIFDLEGLVYNSAFQRARQHADTDCSRIAAASAAPSIAAPAAIAAIAAIAALG